MTMCPGFQMESKKAATNDSLNLLSDKATLIKKLQLADFLAVLCISHATTTGKTG